MKTRMIGVFVALLALPAVVLGAGPQTHENVHQGEPIGSVKQIYDGALMPDLQVNTFRNIDRLFAVREIDATQSPRLLQKSDEQISELQISSDDRTYDLFDYISLNRVSGLLVIKDGIIRHESYHYGNNDKTRWMSMSVAKSITAVLAGIAINEGYIEDIDDPVVRYLPSMKGTAYDGVSVRHLLQMTSGVSWDETYTNPLSDRRALLEAQISQRPGAMLDVMAALPRAASPGTRWNYSTGETQILAAVVSAAVSKPLSEYTSDKIWVPFGMEAKATWWLDSPGGLEIGGSGFSATLRDYGRFGLFLLEGGVANDEETLPHGWLAEATTAKTVDDSKIPYGYMFWPSDADLGPIHEGSYSAAGIFGQRIYVNPRENTVIVTWGARSKPLGTTVIPDMAAFEAIIRAIQ